MDLVHFYKIIYAEKIRDEPLEVVGGLTCKLRALLSGHKSAHEAITNYIQIV